MRLYQTPSAFLFDELRKQAGLSNRDAALLLLSDRPIYAGRSPRDRVGERTYLSREVVHVQPDRVNPSVYGDFAFSAQTITARLASANGRGLGSYAAIIERYGGDAAQTMAAILDSYGYQGRIYLNTVMRVLSAELERPADRAVLLVMAFCVVGCLCDPRAAADRVERFMREKLSSNLGTVFSGGKSGTIAGQSNADSQQLGLIRVFGDAMRPPIYPLSMERDGTILGSLPSEGRSSITDVEVDVSRQHLIVWYQNGAWWCQGLGSTNGTFLTKGRTGELMTVEPARRSMTAPYQPTPHQIEAGDVLCLGSMTHFLVMQLSG